MSDKENKIHTEILSIDRLLFSMSLSIPEYQRPYKWSPKNVHQLIDDILLHKNKSSYRIGTVVLHQDTKSLDIVDGQQRMLTLTLITYALFKNKEELITKFFVTNKKSNNIEQLSLLKLEFENDISKHNLSANYKEIIRRVDVFGEKEIDFFFTKCQMVSITLYDISEAFQFFDSQNARGKDLDPHDLLKAFHLREMASASEAEKMETVAEWESLDAEKLAHLFDNYLFRVRNWSKGKSARYFTKNEVNLFKGISFDHTENFPFEYAYRINHFYTEKYNANIERNIDLQKREYPFQLDQIIINGKRFFEMVIHYHKIVKKLEGLHWLFNKTEKERMQRISFLSDYDDQANNNLMIKLGTYDGKGRVGNQYVRNLFDCCLLYYMDRFGTYNLDKALVKFFIWSYSIRLELHAVQLASVDNKAIMPNFNFFKKIREAVHPAEVYNKELAMVDRLAFKNDPIITKLFKKYKYLDERN